MHIVKLLAVPAQDISVEIKKISSKNIHTIKIVPVENASVKIKISNCNVHTVKALAVLLKLSQLR